MLPQLILVGGPTNLLVGCRRHKKIWADERDRVNCIIKLKDQMSFVEKLPVAIATQPIRLGYPTYFYTYSHFTVEEEIEKMSLRSSQECSPPCQGGGRGFKSHQGRLKIYGMVRKLEKRRSSDLRDCLWVRLPLMLLELTHASAGHWRAQVAVTHPLRLCRFDSCPMHFLYGPFVYR